MTGSVPTPPRQATRRVSDEDIALDISRHELSADGRGSPNSHYFYALRDSRAREADLTRRLAEAERARDEAWCAGRDAAAAAATDHDVSPVCSHDEYVDGYAQGYLSARDQIVESIRALNPPKPEGDRG